MAKVEQNWENDGHLTITNANTIGHYNELNDERNKHEFEGIFYAFSNDQFERGLKRVKHLMKEGEKLVQFCSGGYGVREYIQKMRDYYKQVDERIKNECDPQEVYWYEYNNYECCISSEMDEKAILTIIQIWGVEVAKTIKRLRPCGSVERVDAMHTRLNVGELAFEDGTTTENVYIDEDGKVLGRTQNREYQQLFKDGKPYLLETGQEAYCELSGWYKNGWIYDWYVY